MSAEISKLISEGRAILGIELGSTRIKAVLIDEAHSPIAGGTHDWENRFENGVWTYHLEDVWNGLADCYKKLKDDVKEKYGVSLTKVGSMGFSAMMHGYLAFDKDGEQIAEFRTWRNTSTEKVAAILTEKLNFNIPQRWSIAHLYQAMLNGEGGVKDIDFLTTLAGYVHFKLTGERVLGIGDASGVFPIDSKKNDYDASMMATFDNISAEMGYSWSLNDILPKVLLAGQGAGTLSDEGAKLLDPSGELCAGIPLCPPEGDAGTGMTATNSVAVRTGNVSAGTSVFAMIVLEKALKKVHTEIDMVTTPTGKPVAMVHCNNCSSDIDAWAGVMKQFAQALGVECKMGKALDTLFFSALEADADCGGVVSCNYYSGEPITGIDEGRPLVARMPEAKFSLANFSRSLLYSAMATLKIGMDILTEEEQVALDALFGHGGYFKAEGVGQKMLAAALKTPVSVMSTAGEGGPWGMAILAAYMLNKKDGEQLDGYLNENVFANASCKKAEPNEADCVGFDKYMKAYNACLNAEKSAVQYMKIG